MRERRVRYDRAREPGGVDRDGVGRRCPRSRPMTALNATVVVVAGGNDADRHGDDLSGDRCQRDGDAVDA